MRPEDLLDRLRKQPFEPFRLHLSDGATFTIRHPDMAFVEKSRIIIAVPDRRSAYGPAERTVHCALVHVTRTEPIVAA